jgi:glycosyltransferase involved in cell wall biosynthesis
LLFAGGLKLDMKKVLFIIRSFNAGGTEISLLNLLKTINRNQYNVTVMALYGTGELREEFEKQTKCICVYDMKKRHLPGSGRIYGKIFGILPSSILHSMLVRDKYDIEIAYMNGKPAKLVSGAQNNIKKCVWFHMGYPEDSKFEQMDLFFSSTPQIVDTYNRFDAYICVTQTQAKTLKKISKGYMDLPDEKIHIIHNTIDKDRVNRLSTEKCDLPESVQKNIFICCARLEPEKGVDRLLRAAKELKLKGENFSILICGTGGCWDDYQKYIRTENLEKEVFLLGFQPNPYKYMRKADVYISPSYFEGYGLSIAEAIALNMPIISTECEGPVEIMSGYGKGGIIKNDDNAICEAMLSWIRGRKSDWFVKKNKEYS